MSLFVFRKLIHTKSKKNLTFILFP